MKSLKIMFMSFVFLVMFSSIAFAWSGSVKGFTISAVSITSSGVMEVWGRTSTGTYDVKFTVPSDDEKFNRLLSIVLTAKSTNSAIDLYSSNGRMAAVAIK